MFECPTGVSLLVGQVVHRFTSSLDQPHIAQPQHANQTAKLNTFTLQINWLAMNELFNGQMMHSAHEYCDWLAGQVAAQLTCVPT